MPQLRNINQDPQMSGMTKYPFTDGDNKIGKKTPEFTPTIAIKGSGIAMEHCLVNYQSDTRTCTLSPNRDDPKSYQVRVNGDLVEEPTTLVHGDRLLIGSHHYYLYVDPLVNSEEMFEWETAMKEANKEAMGMFK